MTGILVCERIVTVTGHWSNGGSRLDKAVEAYSKSVATLESCVLVSAWRLRDLKAAPEGVEIKAIEPVKRQRPRQSLRLRAAACSQAMSA